MPKKFGINSKSLESKEKKQARDNAKIEQQNLEKEKNDQKLWSIGAKNNSKKIQEEEKRLEKLRLKNERLKFEENERNTLPETKNEKNKDKSQENYEIYAASNIDDALVLLDCNKQSKTLERHPERRVKAAFVAFESKELPQLKKEFPFLKYSQLREKLGEKWKKSPDNPLNQIHISHKTTKEEELHLLEEQNKSSLERLRL